MDRTRKVGRLTTFPLLLLLMSFNSDVLEAVEVLAARSRLCPVLKLQNRVSRVPLLLMPPPPQPRRDLSTTSARLSTTSRCLEAF